MPNNGYMHRNFADMISLNDQLSVIHWNIEGIMSREFGNKIRQPELLNILNIYDIIALTETHANQDILINLPGYNSVQVNHPKHHRSRKHSGGLAILVKLEIREAVSFSQSTSKDILWLKIKSDALYIISDVYFGVVYISPKNPFILPTRWNHPQLKYWRRKLQSTKKWGGYYYRSISMLELGLNLIIYVMMTKILLPRLMYIMQIAKCLWEWAVMIKYVNLARKC